MPLEARSHRPHANKLKLKLKSNTRRTMKPTLSIPMLLLVVANVPFVSLAQQTDGPDPRPMTNPDPNPNVITGSEFGAITYNGATIDQIEATLGNEQELAAIFGMYSLKDEDTSPVGVIYYNYGENTVGYDPEFQQISVLEIKDNTWPVVVKGRTIRVGDSIQDLKAKFGANFEVSTSKYGPEKFSGFNSPENSFSDLFIWIDPTTNQITKIKYYILP